MMAVPGPVSRVRVLVLAAAPASLLVPLRQHILRGQLLRLIAAEVARVLRRHNAVQRLQSRGVIELRRMDGQRRRLRARPGSAHGQPAFIIWVQWQSLVRLSDEGRGDHEHGPRGHERAHHAAPEYLPSGAR